jgi:cell division protein FtsW
VHPNGPDLAIVAVVVALTVIGLVLVYSASFAIALSEFGNANYIIIRQAAGTLLGLACMVVLARTDYRALRRWSPLLLLVALIGLLLVLSPAFGHHSYGASRWIRLGPLPPLQPSEFAKLAMVVYIAAWLAAKGEQVKQFSLGVVPFVMMVGLVGGLIMLEPDLGTFLVIGLTTGTMFFVAGASISHVFTLGLSGLACGGLLIAFEGYRWERLLAFLHPSRDPAGAGFQINQLLIALGSGGVRGLGLGESRQKFFYVPGAHTDGIFAILGEEMGLVGCVVVLILFGVLIGRGLRTAVKARDDFGYLLAVGITCWIAYQSIINIAGISSSLPLTGIPLPFLSYGSSAMVAVLAAVGVLLSVSRYQQDQGYLARRRASEPQPAEARKRKQPSRSPASAAMGAVPDATRENSTHGQAAGGLGGPSAVGTLRALPTSPVTPGGRGPAGGGHR